jgi:DNA topoisomerase I
MQHLIFADQSAAGITRRLIRGHWAYFDAAGERIANRDEIDRLNRIALPPAYEHAWFAPDPRAHIQATGIDAKGRKQYRYHPDFRADREASKFGSCIAFGEALPLIRARAEKDAGKRKLTSERAIASIVRLLDSGRIRIGNEAYARANKSFGATTLRMRHARLDHGRLLLRFKAKSGKLCEIKVTDRRLVRFVKQMQDLPGQHLFQYLQADGTVGTIGSGEVNAYIHETMGADFTAKHFRTWRASTLAFEWLATHPGTGLKPMLDFVASELGNTPSIARKSYIHPALIDLAKGDAKSVETEIRPKRASRWLSAHERGLLAFLKAREGNKAAGGTKIRAVASSRK